MTLIAEPTRAERWLYTQLTTDGTISGIVGTRVYAEVMPQEVTTYPAIVFQFIPGQQPIYGNGAVIIWQKVSYLVKAITEGKKLGSLQTLIDQLSTVLHAQRGGTADAAIDYCLRKEPFRMTTVENGQTYQHLGYTFEMAVRAADV